jgi:hypothetical protein
MFSLHQIFPIEGFQFNIEIPIPTNKENYDSTNVITGSYTIKSLEKYLQAMFNATYNGLIKKLENEKKTEIFAKLKAASRAPIKFRIQKVDNKHVLVFNTPFPVKVVNVGNFCKLFKFEQTIKQNTIMQPNIEHVSESIHEITNPLPIIEWHCNIAEYSYINHDEHAHLHKQEELLHISFIDSNFYKKTRVQREP